jgi:hypothetical protein
MTRALVVIDVQESFRQLPSWAAISNPGIVGQVFADPLTLPVADIIARTEYALAGRFATVRTVAELAANARHSPSVG